MDESVAPRCVTRWRPSEVAAGVSDLEVFEEIAKKGGATWLRQDLHAKYYRSEEEVWVGSANLTGSGLGWSESSNLEILIEGDPVSEELACFENEVFDGAVEVDRELYDRFREAAKDWKRAPKSPFGGPVTSLMGPASPKWLPGLRNPRDLFAVYQAPEDDALPTFSRQAAAKDLEYLALPPGLTEEDFHKGVAAALLATPMIYRVDRFVSTPRRFGAVRSLLQESVGCSRQEADRLWQTLIRWLRFFLPERYEYTRPKFSEIMARRNAEGESEGRL